ncbi:SDR family oxidoreductase [Gordonia crocea]|uniref:3-ketoacyl-ACP reductase n=1 Tax=Gordonia crocea TaxID=589162 RepID=A0A7M3SVA9_9ACTN|nr:SDR family oxidoreductase [Gordonia crocea]GED96583.1 3-ketoacyl-ACP reductase [Gordonia crocea]
MTGTDLTNKTAIVTGASRGIGLASARALTAAGANVVVTARKQESADAAAAEIGGSALGVAAHAAEEEQAARCVDIAIETFGGVDILVNNAATNPAYGPLIAQDRAVFTKIVEVNLWAPLMWTRLVAERWMGEHGGSIINTASIGGMTHEPVIGLYNTTKAALIYLTTQLALELSPGIRVNAVAPGVVRTRLAEALWKEHEAQVAGVTALGRIGEPDDIASAVEFLASDASSWMTGETVVVDGGMRHGDARPYRMG